MLGVRSFLATAGGLFALALVETYEQRGRLADLAAIVDEQTRTVRTRFWLDGTNCALGYATALNRQEPAARPNIAKERIP